MNVAKTKLKNIHLTSVDLCQQGANPDAKITLYKSADAETAHSPVSRAWSRIKDTLSVVRKDAQTFGDVEGLQETRRTLYQYQDAFYSSIQSILGDGEQDDSTKRDLLLQSLSEFNDAMTDWIGTLFNPADENFNKTGKGDNDMDESNFDLSALSAEDQKTFKGLLGKVKPAAKKPAATPKDSDPKPALAKKFAAKPDGTTDPAPETDPAAPAASESAPAASTETAPADDKDPVSKDPAVQKAINRMNALSEKLEKSLRRQEEKEMQEVAKKYAPLGKKPEDLAKTLCTMKASGQAAYDAYVGALDKALDAVQKSDSGLFGEIGKSNHQYEAATGSVQKAEEIAKSIREKDPKMTQQQAMAKAFELHPELEAAYEKDYEGGKA